MRYNPFPHENIPSVAVLRRTINHWAVSAPTSTCCNSKCSFYPFASILHARSYSSKDKTFSAFIVMYFEKCL